MDLFHTLGTFFIPFRPGTLRQTIAYHMVLIITNRYENLAPGMKTGHLGMKQMPRVWKVCIKVWKKTMAVLSQTSCIPYVFNYTKMVWKCCTRYEKSSFGYETNAKGMKSLHDGMKQMTNVLKQTHLWRMPDLRAIVLDGLDASVHPSVFQTPPCIPCIGRPHGVSWCGGFPSLGSRTTKRIFSGRYWCGVGLFCTFQDGICVVWVCFVPFVLFSSLFIYNWNHTVPFSQRKRVENCIVCQ